MPRGVSDNTIAIDRYGGVIRFGSWTRAEVKILPIELHDRRPVQDPASREEPLTGRIKDGVQE
jgi:hypothetical protein